MLSLERNKKKVTAISHKKLRIFLMLAIGVGYAAWLTYSMEREKPDSQVNNKPTEKLTLSEPPKEQKELIQKRAHKLEKIHDLLESHSTKQNLNRALQLTREILPLKKEAKELDSQQVHVTPPSNVLAGKALGEIKDAIAESPNLRSRVERFYQECANNQLLRSTIRALCLTDFALLRRQKGQRVKLSRFPKRLRRLAREILRLN